MAISSKSLSRLLGYTVVLSTALDVEECRRRLHADFSDAKGRMQHAHSDKKLTGRFMGDQFVIIYSPLAFSRNVSLALWVQLQPIRHGADIHCRHSRLRKSSMVVTVLLSIAIGAALTLFGLYQLFAGAGVIMLVTGLFFLGINIAILSAPFDRGAMQEREYIVRYLERLLGARPCSAVTPRAVSRPGVKIVR